MKKDCFWGLKRKRDKFEMEVMMSYLVYVFSIVFGALNLVWFGILLCAIINTCFSSRAYIWLLLQAFNVFWSFAAIIFCGKYLLKLENKDWTEE